GSRRQGLKLSSRQEWLGRNPSPELVILSTSMFQDALCENGDKTDGGLASLIMDSEGIAVESYVAGDAPFDINTIGIEFGVVLGSIKRAAESLEAGKAHEVAIGTDKMITLIRTLGDTYFLALT